MIATLVLAATAAVLPPLPDYRTADEQAWTTYTRTVLTQLMPEHTALIAQLKVISRPGLEIAMAVCMVQTSPDRVERTPQIIAPRSYLAVLSSPEEFAVFVLHEATHLVRDDLCGSTVTRMSREQEEMLADSASLRVTDGACHTATLMRRMLQLPANQRMLELERALIDRRLAVMDAMCSAR